MRFPSIVYRSPGPHFGPPVDGKSTTYESAGVDNDDELTEALAHGWFVTLEQAVDPSKRPEVEPFAPENTDELRIAEAAVVDEDKPAVAPPTLAERVAFETSFDAPVAVDEPTRADLEAEAKALGIHVDGRWSDKRLAEKIDAAKKAG